MTGQKVWFITGAGRGIGSDLVTAALVERPARMIPSQQRRSPAILL
jgi:NAD(P)-dependent dehydrogenase (short-subunit alcohol dehydrogenase family)